MHESRRELVENTLELSIETIKKDTSRLSRVLDAKSKSGVDVPALLRSGLERYYKSHPVPDVESKAYELVPWIHGGSRGLALGSIRELMPTESSIKRTLMFSHRVAMVDPLLRTYSLSSRGYSTPYYILSTDSREVDFLERLQLWATLEPLLDQDIVLLYPPPPLHSEDDDFRLLREIMRDQELRALAASTYPEFKDQFFRGVDGPLMSRIYDINISRVAIAQYPSVSYWFRSLRENSLFSGIGEKIALRGMRPETEHLTRFFTLDIPSTESLALQDTVDIRLNADTFEDWRCVLSDALRSTSDFVDGDEQDERTVEEIRIEMSRYADRASRELKTSRRDGLEKAVRAAAFGSVSAVATSAVDGLLAVAAGVGGAAFEAGAEVAAEFFKGRSDRRAKKAAVRHAVALATPTR